LRMEGLPVADRFLLVEILAAGKLVQLGLGEMLLDERSEIGRKQRLARQLSCHGSLLGQCHEISDGQVVSLRQLPTGHADEGKRLRQPCCVLAQSSLLQLEHMTERIAASDKLRDARERQAEAL